MNGFCQKRCCPECGKEITIPNFQRHLNTHISGTYSKYHKITSVQHDGLNCIYCGKECKNRNSLAQHEIRCKENPNKIDTLVKNFNDGNMIPWNKGATKETDERVAQQAAKSSKSLSGKPGRKHTEEEKKKLSENAKKSGLGGFAWRRGVKYKEFTLGSSYEVEVAKSLDLNHIKWSIPQKMQYYVEGVLHHYTADFYLDDFDIYLDPKNDFLIDNVNPNLGYKDVDKIKWVQEQNNVRIIILNKDQLSWEIIKTLI